MAEVVSVAVGIGSAICERNAQALPTLCLRNSLSR